MNYSNKQGIIQTSNQSKIVARLTFDQYAFDDKLKIGLSVANAKVVSDYVPLLGAVLYQTAYHLPTSPVQNADGSYFENFTKNGYFNPVAILNNAQSQQKNNNVIAAFTINAKLPFGLTYDMERIHLLRYDLSVVYSDCRGIDALLLRQKAGRKRKRGSPHCQTTWSSTALRWKAISTGITMA